MEVELLQAQPIVWSSFILIYSNCNKFRHAVKGSCFQAYSKQGMNRSVSFLPIFGSTSKFPWGFHINLCSTQCSQRCKSKTVFFGFVLNQVSITCFGFVMRVFVLS